MLKFYDYTVTNSLEVPDEVCLNFYIAECQNHCPECFLTELREMTDVLLSEVYSDIMDAYSGRITCVCFLGEGRNTESEHKEFSRLCEHIHSCGFKTCLYSGRDCGVEEWMNCFDYVKLGSYKSEFGDLSERTTNQKLYKKTSEGYSNITCLFWEQQGGVT